MSWPFASLEATPEKIVVRSALGGSWSFEAAQIDSLTLGRALVSKGLRIRHSCAGYPTPLIFWTLDSARLESALANLGYTILHGSI